MIFVILTLAGLNRIEVTCSSLFNKQKSIEQLLIPVDEKIFNTLERGNAKLKFGLPKHAKVIFFGSAMTTEKRKGLNYIVTLETLRVDRRIILIFTTVTQEHHVL